MRSLLALPLAVSASIALGQYNGPESVEYDPNGDRYFVSNTGASAIKQRAQDGTVTNFVTGIGDSPYGLELQGDTLFACVGGGVKGYLTANAQQVFDLDLGGTFPNGITSDGHFLYVTDFSQQRIFRVEPATNSFTTWVNDTQGTPNGIVFDATNDRLVVAFWGSNAAVKTYDRATATPGISMNTGLGNIDGITVDCLGQYLIASWSPNQISRIVAFDQAPVAIVTTGLNHPADIDMDAYGNVCVPNAGNNTVSILAVPECATQVAENDGYTTINAVPNPTDGLVRLELDFVGAQPFMVYNSRGLLVASGNLHPHAMLDVSSLAPGIYTIELARIKRYVRVVKR